jgi:hypothetical protein
MTLAQLAPQTNTIEITAARSNGRNYFLTLEDANVVVEAPVSERTYRRALIDMLSPEDVAELHVWLNERDAEVVEMHEAEISEWQPLPADDMLDDMADYYAGQARANGFALNANVQEPADKLAQLAESNGYETVDEYIDDAAYDLVCVMLDHDCRISQEDARQYVTDSEGDVQHAADMLLEDIDWSDPRQEAHFSPWFLNS